MKRLFILANVLLFIVGCFFIQSHFPTTIWEVQFLFTHAFGDAGGSFLLGIIFGGTVMGTILQLIDMKNSRRNKLELREMLKRVSEEAAANAKINT